MMLPQNSPKPRNRRRTRMPTWGWLASPKSTAGEGAAAGGGIVVIIGVDDNDDCEGGAPRSAADDNDDDDDNNEEASARDAAVPVAAAREAAEVATAVGGAMLPTIPKADDDMARLPRARPAPPPPPARLPRARATGKFVGGCAAPAPAPAVAFAAATGADRPATAGGAIGNAACSAPPTMPPLRGLLSDSDKALASFACCLSVSDTAMVQGTASAPRQAGSQPASQSASQSLDHWSRLSASCAVLLLLLLALEMMRSAFLFFLLLAAGKEGVVAGALLDPAGELKDLSPANLSSSLFSHPLDMIVPPLVKIQ